MGTGIDYTFKILMLGAASTGKSSLSDRFVSGIFNPNIKMTVGVEFFVKTVDTVDNKGIQRRIKMQIWDLGGEDRFRFLLPTYCLGSSGAIFLFDLTRPETLNSLDSWVQIVREKNSDIPILLVGNKSDLDNLRKVTLETGNDTCNQNGLYKYIEVSALNGQNVEDLFLELTGLMLSKAQLMYS